MTFANDDDELIRHAQSLRGLARSLVGGEHAEDLLQDVALQALHTAGKPPQSWRAWLAVVMRNRAGKWRLTDQRRQVRERHIQDEQTPPVAASALTAAMRRETIQRLDAALLSLPQPYQETLLLRYFEDLTPSEIAARSGESLSTIKSRLQRGLALLRGSLGSDGSDGDWRAAMVLAFGLGGSKPAAVGASVVLVGLLAMTWKLFLGVALAAMLWLWWWPDAVVLPAPDSSVGDRVVAARAATTDALLPTKRTEVAPDSVLPRTREPRDAAQAVTFVGRCVDEEGNALAGVAVQAVVRVELRAGGSSDSVATENWSTDAAGRFRIAVVPGTDAAIELSFESPGRCRCSGRFGDRQAGERVDLGDLLLPLQCVLHVRVVDQAGVPQPGVRVYYRKDRSIAQVLVAPYPQASRAEAGDDGKFVLNAKQALSPGTYTFLLRDRKLLQEAPSTLVVAVGDREKSIELVIGPEPERCSGVVVDVAGVPIERATAWLFDNLCETTVDGQFSVSPDPNRPRSSYVVGARKTGYRTAHTTWNGEAEQEVRIVLLPEPGIVVRVVDDGTGVPIEQFAVWLASSDRWPQQATVPMGKHDGGAVRVAAEPGEHFVMIETPGAPPAVSQLQPVAVAEQVGADVTMRIRQQSARSLVVLAGGKPMAGVGIEVIDRGGQPVGLATKRLPLGAISESGDQDARLVQRTVTDDRGSATLHGPAGPLALVLSGGAVAHQVVQPVRLDSQQPLVLHVAKQAILSGRLVPEAVAHELWQAAQPKPNEDPKPFGIQLWSPEHGEFQQEFARPFPIDEFAHFEIEGLPPGTWRIRVLAGCSFAVAEVAIRDGEQLEREFDIAALTPANVLLRVTVNGDPVANSLVMLMGKHALDATQRRFTSSQLLPTDAAGQLRALTWPGDFEAEVFWLGQRFKTMTQVAGRGDQVVHLAVQTGSLTLQLLDSAGKSVATMIVRDEAQSWQGTTDASGRLQLDTIVAGTHVLQVLPLHLRTEQQRNEFNMQHGWQSLATQWLSLAPIVIIPGSTTTLSLTVPEQR
jgi:RNA polymerase sigma factor (sigma-70 family)